MVDGGVGGWWKKNLRRPILMADDYVQSTDVKVKVYKIGPMKRLLSNSRLADDSHQTAP